MVFKKIDLDFKIKSIFLEKKVFSNLEMKEIEEELKTGICDLYHFEDCGYVITRDEDLEIVMVGGVGKRSKSVIDYFAKTKKKQGFKTMRLHSKRIGMGRFLFNLGFDEVGRIGTEVIYRVAL